MAKSEPIEMEATVSQALPNAMFKLKLDGTDISLDGTVTLQAPEAIKGELEKFGIPTTVAEAAFRVQMDPGRPEGENFAEATFSAVGGSPFPSAQAKSGR